MAGGKSWRSLAFGLEVESDAPIVGLPSVDEQASGRPRVRVRQLTLLELEPLWRKAPGGGGPPQASRSAATRLTLDLHDGAGYRLRARGFGAAVVSGDGSLISFAPDGPGWRAHRFLVGRALPLAAVLGGMEVFHASSVALGDSAVALIGPSSAGKTSLAVNLMLRGAAFITDDVLAVEAEGDEVVAHPGPALASIRPTERAALLQDSPTPARRAALGELFNGTEATYAAVEREERRLPLRIAYVIRRRGDTTAFRSVAPPDPRLLLASTFVFEVRTPERMRRQLDVCARMAKRVKVFELDIPTSSSAAATASEIRSHAAETLSATPAPER